MSINRPQVSDETLLKAIEVVTHHVGLRIEKHGRGAFASPHEGLGVMAEEYHELIDACKENDLQNYAEEMIDLAVGGIFGLASMIQSAPAETPAPTPVEDAAEQARRLMIERASQSGIVISSTISE